METLTPTKGLTIMLVGGNYFDLEDPASSTFGIDDIAHALANICRYTGHCQSFYSVAQHSVLVSRAVPAHDAFAGLMHGAAEAFIGDVAKPLMSLLPNDQDIEDRIEAAVFARLGLPAKLPGSVKVADRVLLRTEQRDLMGADDHPWADTAGVELLPERIEPLPPSAAKRSQAILPHALRRTGPRWAMNCAGLGVNNSSARISNGERPQGLVSRARGAPRLACPAACALAAWPTCPPWRSRAPE